MRLEPATTISYLKIIPRTLLFNGISKVLVFLVNFFVAFFFGATEVTDIYFVCITIVLLAGNFISHVSASVIIPEAIRISDASGLRSSTGFLNRYCLYLVIIAVALAIVLSGKPTFFFGLISNFEMEFLARNEALIRLSSIALFFHSISTVFNDLLISRRNFTLPLLVSIMSSIIIILSVFLMRHHAGIHSAIWGNVVAGAASIILQLFVLLRYVKWRFTCFHSSFSEKVRKDILFTMLGYLTAMLCAFVPVYLLSGYAGGYVTSLHFGQRIAEAPNTIISIQLAVVAGMRFNELYPKGDFSGLNEFFLKIGRLLVFLLVPVSLAVAAFSMDISFLLFGKSAIDTSALEQISEFLKWLILACPLAGINILTSRVFMAAQKIKEAFYYQIATNLILILLSWAAVKTIGPDGYAYGYLLFYAVNFIGLYFFSRYLLNFLRYQKLMVYAVFIYSFSFLSLFVASKAGAVFNFSGLMNMLLILFFYFSIILIASLVFKVNKDVNALLNRIVRRA